MAVRRKLWCWQGRSSGSGNEGQERHKGELHHLLFLLLLLLLLTSAVHSGPLILDETASLFYLGELISDWVLGKMAFPHKALS